MSNILRDKSRVLVTSASATVDKVQVVLSEATEVSTGAIDVVVCAVTLASVEQVVSMVVGVNHSSVQVELYIVTVPSMVVSGESDPRLEGARVTVAESVVVSVKVVVKIEPPLAVYTVTEPVSLEFAVGNGGSGTRVSDGVGVLIVTMPDGPLDIRKVVVPVVVRVVGTGKTTVDDVKGPVVLSVEATALVRAVPGDVGRALPVPSGNVVLARGNGTVDAETLSVGTLPGKPELGVYVLVLSEPFTAPVLEKPVGFTPVESGGVDIGPVPVLVIAVVPTEPVPNIEDKVEF